MPSKSRAPRRKSLRLESYDYSQAGAYFVTIVTRQREPLFGEIIAGEMRLNRRCEIAAQCWQEIPEHFPQAELGTFVIMPNHVHGNVVIQDMEVGVGARHVSPLPQPHHPPHGVKPGSLSAIVGSFKSAVSRLIGIELDEAGIWQRGFYYHIIRSEEEWRTLHAYIESNPTRWDEDQENPN
jgi:putative transposase